jgi:hypothetical protein
MSKTKNNPSTYRQRADLARLASAPESKSTPKRLPKAKQALLISLFGAAGDQKAGYVPFGRLVRK